MITRHDSGRRVTYYGDAPIRDHEGYIVETGCEDGADLMIVRVAFDDNPVHAIRADLPPAKVAELRARCDAFLQDHKDKR